MSIGKNYQSLFLTVGGVALLALFIYSAMNNPFFGGQVSSRTAVYFGPTKVAVEVETNAADQARGLSGRASLPAGSGMLFVFDSDAYRPFWMKDMQFSIDIIWIDSSGRVVTVIPNLSPDTYYAHPPQTFVSTLPARYVLEVPAGFAAQNNIYEGAVMTFGNSTPE